MYAESLYSMLTRWHSSRREDSFIKYVVDSSFRNMCWPKVMFSIVFRNNDVKYRSTEVSTHRCYRVEEGMMAVLRGK